MRNLYAAFIQTRPVSRGRIGAGTREFDFSKGFTSTNRINPDRDPKSMDKIAISIDRLKSTKIGSLSSTKKLSFNGYIKKVRYPPLT